jgi:predicted Holliday junction resolvase-like endonuclease
LIVTLLWILRKNYLINPVVLQKTLNEKEKEIYKAIDKSNDSYNELSKKYLLLQNVVALNKKETEGKFEKIENKIDELKEDNRDQFNLFYDKLVNFLGKK